MPTPTAKQIQKQISAPGELTIRGFTVKIEYDRDPLNPRKEWDNVGTMVCWHRRYNLGDKQPGGNPSEFYAETLEPILKAGGIVLPLYLYDHSGITMSTSAFSCPWDSGQVGWIYATAETIRKEWAGKSGRITRKVRERATRYLTGEVETYDQYLTGDVYGYSIEDNDGKHVDGCWGFFGRDHVVEEAAAVLAHILNETPEQAGITYTFEDAQTC